MTISDHSLGFTDVDEDDPLIVTMRRFEAEVDSHGWEKPALLAFLGQTDFPEVGLAGVCAYPIPIPFLAPPRDTLSAVADRLTGDSGLRAKLRRLVPGKLYGAMVSTEIWMLVAEQGTPEEAGARVVGEAGMIHADPDRIEARGILAITIDGRTEMLMHLRHRPPPIFTAAGHEGAVMRQLGRVVQAMVR
jgi:hypothetical protein